MFTEPLWGISINLILPYASVYMIAKGLSDTQVGFIAMVFMLSQMVCSFLGGPITDKLGRRLTTAVFDFTAWSIPCLIWWWAGNFWFFFIAAIINGTTQIVTNSWNCLIAEDAEKEEITGISSLISIAVHLSALLGPVTILLFSRLGLVSAMRILYINGFLIMTFKVWLTYHLSRETQMGRIRMEETRGKNIFSLAAGYGNVFRIIAKSPDTIFTLVISVIVGIVIMINTTFWQIIVSKKLLVPVKFLPIFPLLRSVISIVFLFFIMPRMSRRFLKLPLLVGFVCFIIGHLILVITPSGTSFKYVMLCVSLVFDGFSISTLQVLVRALIALNVNPKERARLTAILYLVTMAATAPFGWIGGILSDISRSLPFIMNLCLLGLGVYVTEKYFKKPQITH